MTSAAAIARSRFMRVRSLSRWPRGCHVLALGTGYGETAMKNPIDACHHVAIVVRDASAAREFYGDLLGLEELERPADVGQRFAGAWYRLGALELHVFEQPEFQPPTAAIGPHIALHTVDFD